MRIRLREFVLLALVASAIGGGCARTYKLSKGAVSTRGGNWSHPQYRPDGNAVAPVSSFDGSLDVVWETRAPGKPAGPLTLTQGVLAYPSARRRIRFYDAASGRYRGRLKSREEPQGGLTQQDSLGWWTQAPRSNRLVCFDMKRADEQWHAEVKDAVGGTILVENRLLVASSTGRLQVFDATSGDTLWSYRDSGRCLASPTVSQQKVFLPIDHGSLVALDLATGKQLWRVETNEPLVSPVVADQSLYLATMSGVLMALSAEDGLEIWSRRLGTRIWSSPVVVDDLVVVGTSGGAVEAFDAQTGQPRWQFVTGQVVRAGVIATGNIVIAGCLKGRLVTLDLSSGRLIAERQLEGGIEYPPITDGERVYVATRSGHLSCFGDVHAQASSNHNRDLTLSESKRTGPLCHARVGDGSPQGFDLRPGSPDGRKGR